MKTIKISFLFTLLNLLTICAVAQDLKGTPILLEPAEYTRPNGPTGEIAQRYDDVTRRPWIVYSDRSDNISYTNEQFNTKKKDLPYLKAFLVIARRGHALHIVDYGPMHYAKNKLNERPQDYGWVDERKMLLWQNSVLDPNTKIITKGLAMFHYEVLKNPGAYFKSNNIQVYNNPDKKEEHVATNELQMYQFVFIYKEENGAYLVGKQQKTKYNTISHELIGWVDKGTIQVWEGRLCLEPNRSIDAVDERKSKNVSASIFGTSSDAKSFSVGTAGGDPIWDSDPKATLIPSNFKRFPVLKTEYGLVRTGFSSPIVDERGVVLSSVQDKNKSDEKYMDFREEKKKINVIFVIDGNAENKNFVKPIIESIKLNYSYLGNNTSNQYFFGSVIYRKDAYASCEGVDKSLQVKTLTSNYRDLTSWLSQSLNDELCPVSNATSYTNLTDGLARANRMLAGKSSNTNIVIVIGAAGVESSKSEEMKNITNSLSKANASLLAFQVNSKNDVAFDNFYRDMRRMIAGNARNIVNDIKASNISEQLKASVDIPAWARNQDDYFDELEQDKSPISGSISFVELGQEMQVARLTSELKKTILSVESWNNKLISDLDVATQSVGGTSVKVNPAMVLFLKESGIGLDDKIVEKISGKSYQFYVEGYTTLTNDKLDNPVFTYQLLMLKSEYDNLVNRFKRLYEARGSDNMDAVRKRLKRAYKEVLASYQGSKQVAMRNMDIRMAHSLLTGIPPDLQSHTIKNVSIDDIDDKRLFSNEELDELLNHISTNLKQLERIPVEDSYIFKNFDDIMYWVPVDYLP